MRREEERDGRFSYRRRSRWPVRIEEEAVGRCCAVVSLSEGEEEDSCAAPCFLFHKNKKKARVASPCYLFHKKKNELRVAAPCVNVDKKKKKKKASFLLFLLIFFLHVL